MNLKQAVQRLAMRHPEIEEVWLFGSLARGEAVPGSDADIVIVLAESTLPFLQRCAYYQPDFYGVGVDVLAYTQAELISMQAAGNLFLQRVQSEWVCLFRCTAHHRKPEQEATAELSS